MKLVKMIRSTYSFFSLLIFFLYSAQLAVNANLRVKREEKCYDELGCFENGGDFFDPVTRPIDVLPQDRDVLNTKFHLYTTKNKEDYDDLDLDDKDTITDSSFIPSADTKILVHGHSGNFKAEKWLEELKDKYLEKGDYNVIIVDWSEANVVPFYQAAANARVVGAEIALLVQYLQELKGIKPENVHIIGHSLGSQVAGYAGERLEKLGRITALDPPGPYFTNTAKKVRLDRGDADFVDVIHTDSIVGLGTREAVGHIDFYPNGGDHQPGCLIQPISTLFTEGVEQGVRRLFACDHLRSIDYYIEALDNEKCTPVGIACDNWKKYLDGECSDCGDASQKCIMVGPQAETYREFKNDKKGKKYFFKTAPTKPYCMYNYQIQVTLAKPEDSSRQRGKLYVTIEGEDDNLSIRLSERSERLKPGEQYSYLVSTRKNPGSIEKVKFKWVSQRPTLFDPEFWRGESNKGEKELYLSRVSINPINTGNIEGRKITPSSFCYKTDEPIKSNERVDLKPGECEESIQ